MNDAIKIAKISAQRDLSIKVLDEIGTFLRNPMVILLGTFVTVEALQRWPKDKPLLGSVSGTALETAVVLPTVLPSIVDALSKATSSAGSIATLLATVPK